MKRKGISPLIAAVLLIAFTMAVASIFAQWAPQLIQDAQGDTDERAAEIQDCSSLMVSVVSADNETAVVSQTSGRAPIGELSVTWFYDDADPIQVIGDINESNRGTIQIDLTTEESVDSTSIGDVFTELNVEPVECEGAAPVNYTP